MKFLKPLFFCLLFSFAFGQDLLSQPFEGILNLTAQNLERKENAKLTWMISHGKHKIAFDTESPDGKFTFTLLYEPNSAEVVLLTEGVDKKLYYRIPLENFPKSELIKASSTFIKGNPIKLMSGIECTSFTVQSGEISGTLCLGIIPGFSAKEIPPFMKGNGLLGAIEFANLEGIPLEFALYDKSQKLIVSQTVIGIQNRVVNGVEFDVPPDFEKGN